MGSTSDDIDRADTASAGIDIQTAIDQAADLRRQGRLRAALTRLLTVLEHDDANPRARLELALVLEESGRGSQARTVLAQLARGGDDLPETWRRLAVLLTAEGREEAAASCLRRALALAPAATEAHLTLATLLARRGENAAAAEHYRKALAVAPLAAAHAGLGQSLARLGRVAEAAEQYDHALALEEDNAAARFGRARLGWLTGDLPDAWRDWDSRWPAMGLERPAMPGERWDGGDCAGRIILLFAEHLLADTIQFARYARLVAERGARVVLAVQPQLAGLLAGLDGVDRVLAMGQPVPAGLSFDLNAALSDLPALFGTTLATIPAEPAYLPPPADRRRPIQAPPGSRLKVGLAWIGEQREYQIPFAALMPLLTRPEAAVYSLQTGPRAQDLATLAHPALICDLSPTIGDFADLAARIAEMDLVITADSMVAHLAAAMGRPAWVLLPADADPRWMRGREDCPWYPGMRLFRQARPGDWTAPVDQALAALDLRLAQLREAEAQAAADPLVAHRAMLAAHLAAGDLLIDVGPGAGALTLEAASHPSGDVRVLALEPHATDAGRLRARLAEAGIAARAEVVAAAAGDAAGQAVVAARPRRGRRLFALPDWVAAPVPVVPLDLLLAERPNLAGRRLVVRLGEVGCEEPALRGLWEGLALFQAAVLVFDHRENGSAARLLADAGYRLLQFPGPQRTGRLEDFDGRPGTVLALAPEVPPIAFYGAGHYGAPHPDDLPPVDPAAARRDAGMLAAEGAAAQRAGNLEGAAQAYGRALVRDPANVEANANLAVLLRRVGRLEAAVACSRRALAVQEMPAARANLANALRDLGRLDEAGDSLRRAMGHAGASDDPDLLFNHALLEQARGDAPAARALLERSLALRPDPARRWELGKILLKLGEIGPGLALSEHRPRPAASPPASQTWDGGDCAARTILVRDEGDAIDTVMLARFLPQLARRGALATVECVPELARLLAPLPGVEAVVPRGEMPPACELTVALADLPRLLGTTTSGLPRDVPYLHLPEDMAPMRPAAGSALRVGLAWAGRPGDRACPLTRLLDLAAVPGVALASLQGGPRAHDLTATGARAFIEDLTPGCADYADIAARIAGLDLVVAGDTAEAHIAAAMGKPVWVVLPRNADWRWPEGRESTPWYPTVRVFAPTPDGSWDHAIARMADTLTVLAAAKRRLTSPGNS